MTKRRTSKPTKPAVSGGNFVGGHTYLDGPHRGAIVEPKVMRSITGPIQIKTTHDRERLKKIEAEIASMERETETARSRVPAGILVAEPGAPRQALNLSKEPPVFSRQLIVVCGTKESPGSFALWHFSAGGQCSQIKTRGSNYSQLIEHAFSLVGSHDIIVTKAATFSGKEIGPALTWDDLGATPDDETVAWIARDAGPTDPDRAYFATIWGGSVQTLIKYGSLALSLSQAKEEALKKRGGFVYREAATVAHLPPETPNLPRWIFGEGLVPDYSIRLTALNAELERLRAIPDKYPSASEKAA